MLNHAVHRRVFQKDAGFRGMGSSFNHDFVTDPDIKGFFDNIDKLSTETGTPQGGVISLLSANIFLHVVLDKWRAKAHPEKPFERYAAGI